VHDISNDFTAKLHDLPVQPVALIDERIAGDEPRLAEAGEENDHEESREKKEKPLRLFQKIVHFPFTWKSFAHLKSFHFPFT
jgi:hypothetical protein